MGWMTAVFLMLAAVCLTLAAIHAHVWFRERRAGANAPFAMLAAFVAAMAAVEIAMMHARTPAQWGLALWWLHPMVLGGVIALVWFIRVTLRTGRPWLGWTAIGLRAVVTAINFASTPNVNFSEVTSLEQVSLLGEMLSVGRGTPGPWLPLAQGSLVVLLMFVGDAAWSAWKRGDRRRSLTVGGSCLLFVSMSVGASVATFWGFARVPLFATLYFAPVVLLMAFELSLDLIRSVRLAAELDEKTVALLGSEQKLAFAADAAGAGLWSFDPTSGRLWATPRSMAQFGLAPGREHHVDEVVAQAHAEDRDRVREFLAARSGDATQSLEYRVVLPSGETRWFGVRGAAHVEPDGAQKLMGATIDITERKRAEEETARQRVELEHLARVATVSELSGALAHELNQPLAIIMSNAEAAQLMLQRPDPDLGEVREILGDIVNADERAGEVIRRLRGMLKRGTSQRQPLSLNEIVQGVLRFLRPDLIRRGVALDVALQPGLKNVFADRVPIEQVLINVINNACDAMARNAAGDRALKISTYEDATTACARIEDVGVGLPAHAEQVFDPFYTTKQEGLGMGLAISRSIVASHGGRLVAEPKCPRGAVFTVCLPLAPEGA